MAFGDCFVVLAWRLGWHFGIFDFKDLVQFFAAFITLASKADIVFTSELHLKSLHILLD